MGGERREGPGSRSHRRRRRDDGYRHGRDDRQRDGRQCGHRLEDRRGRSRLCNDGLDCDGGRVHLNSRRRNAFRGGRRNCGRGGDGGCGWRGCAVGRLVADRRDGRCDGLFGERVGDVRRGVGGARGQGCRRAAAYRRAAGATRGGGSRIRRRGVGGRLGVGSRPAAGGVGPCRSGAGGHRGPDAERHCARTHPAGVRNRAIGRTHSTTPAWLTVGPGDWQTL